MKKNLKFFSLMAQLKENEVLGFGKYLRKEYPREVNALGVYHYYRQFYPGKEDPEKMTLPFAFREIYGVEIGTGLSDKKKLWNVLSRLYLWLKDFLIFEKLRTDRYTSDALWLKVLSEKGLTAEYSKEATKAYKTKYQPIFSVAACQQQIELSLHFKQHLVRGRPLPDNRALESCLLNIKEHADFISLKMYCEWLTLKNIRPSKEKIQAVKKVIEPLPLIYDQILSMIETGEAECFVAIEKLLYANIDKIPSEESNSILRYLQNFAGKMVRGSDPKVWGKKLHELNKALLEKDIHIINNAMSPPNFLNIVNVASAASDLDWAIGFVAKYAQYLPQKVREENVLVAEAIIAFERKDFKKVLELTGKPKFRDEIHVMRSKTLQLRAMYELEMDVTNDFEAFYAYLQRHRYPESQNKESSIAFMIVFKMLLEARVSRKELIEALDSNAQILMRGWLREKIQTYQSAVYRRNK